MFRLLSTICPTCQNRFHVEADDGDPPAPVASETKCPRCNGAIRVAADAGEPHALSTQWAIRTGPANPTAS
jgi:hypothetical protein